MAVKIRLRRMGAKKAPFYRIVVADSRQEPSVLKVDDEKAKSWIANGAQPTDTVKALLKKNGTI